MSEVGDMFYRYDYYRTGDDRLEVDCKHYVVHKVTECGVWIKDMLFGGKLRFVLLQTRGYEFDLSKNTSTQCMCPTRKRYAHPDKEAALNSFMCRKYMQRKHLTAQLRNVNSATLIGEAMEKYNEDLSDKGRTSTNELVH